MTFLDLRAYYYTSQSTAVEILLNEITILTKHSIRSALEYDSQIIIFI